MERGSFIDTTTTLGFPAFFWFRLSELPPRLSWDLSFVLSCGECWAPSSRACKLLNEPLKPAILATDNSKSKSVSPTDCSRERADVSFSRSRLPSVKRGRRSPRPAAGGVAAGSAPTPRPVGLQLGGKLGCFSPKGKADVRDKPADRHSECGSIFLEEGEWGGFPRQRPVQLSCCILHLLVMPMETLEVTEVKNRSRNETRCFSPRVWPLTSPPRHCRSEICSKPRG